MKKRLTTVANETIRIFLISLLCFLEYLGTFLLTELFPTIKTIPHIGDIIAVAMGIMFISTMLILWDVTFIKTKKHK